MTFRTPWCPLVGNSLHAGAFVWILQTKLVSNKEHVLEMIYLTSRFDMP